MVDSNKYQAVLALNGEVRGSIADYSHLKNKKFIAADGGALFLEQINIFPEVIIGDLDSLPEQKVIQFKNSGARINEFPAIKDKTDGELALDYCQQRDITSIIIVGAVGGRFDQQLGNVFLLEYAHKLGLETIIWEPNVEMGLIYGTKIIHNSLNHTLSLIPLTEKVKNVHIQGCKYTLAGETLYRYRNRGLSNKITQTEARVEIDDGLLLYVKNEENL